jgi:hypothetical protein
MKNDIACFALLSYAKLQGNAKFFFLEMRENCLIDGWVEAIVGQKRGMQVRLLPFLLLISCCFFAAIVVAACAVDVLDH